MTSDRHAGAIDRLTIDDVDDRDLEYLDVATIDAVLQGDYA